MQGYKTQWNDNFIAFNEYANEKNIAKRKLNDLNIIRKANVLVNKNN